MAAAHTSRSALSAGLGPTSHSTSRQPRLDSHCAQASASMRWLGMVCSQLGWQALPRSTSASSATLNTTGLVLSAPNWAISACCWASGMSSTR